MTTRNLPVGAALVLLSLVAFSSAWGTDLRSGSADSGVMVTAHCGNCGMGGAHTGSENKDFRCAYCQKMGHGPQHEKGLKCASCAHGEKGAAGQGALKCAQCEAAGHHGEHHHQDGHQQPGRDQDGGSLEELFQKQG